jgi:hypothetical protein
MIPLNAKLAKTAFKESIKKDSQNSEKKGAREVFQATLEKVSAGNVNDIVKNLGSQVDLKPKGEVTVIQSQNIENPADPHEDPSEAMQKIMGIMGEVNDGQVKLQRLMELVTSGTKFSPQELIAVQAGVFSLVQELELVGKATQEATQGVRQTLNTNLG